MLSSRMLRILCVVASLGAAPSAEAASLVLGWDDTSVNETGFIVERRISTQSTFEAVASLPADTTAYLDQNLPAGSSYCYRVSAYNSAGTSGYTNDACGTAWNTFATRGRCPGCAHQWRWTSCLRCDQWSPHGDWYEELG